MRKFEGQEGFTLTEVLIAMTILTIAIVSATNLLVGLISSNRVNVGTLKAYYFAQEGIEAVRNIRDTNWLHNRDWLARGDSAMIWGSGFEPTEVGVSGNEYGVDLKSAGWTIGVRGEGEVLDGDNPFLKLSEVAPWSVYSGSGEVLLVTGEETGYKRGISISEYDCGGDDCSDYVLVTSRVEWEENGNLREIKLDAVLTDWKEN